MPGQLSLFKGKRQRGVAAPPPKEFGLQCAVADVLRRWANPLWQWNHIPGGEERPSEFRDGKRVSFAGARLKRAGFQPGWPDFILLPPKEDGRAHFLALKRRGTGRMTATQSAFQLWALLHGYPYAVVDELADAIEILKHWGVVRRGIEVQ